MYQEDGAELYLINDGENFLFHANIKGKVTHNRLKHFDEVFLAVIMGLMEQGLNHVTALVPMEEDKLNFARYFGFEELPTVRVFSHLHGPTVSVREMIYIFPDIENA